ncbi:MULTISPECIES: beta-glucosidase [Xanthomonas]|uniref:beta-glucosidase n=1 Tax=Xanthomonas TaxID=338 RepID=UPI001ADC2907|nr:beta-glucosidase [Xanthomonas phaseoli]MBO9766872.1 beta-glucosidase [Xanthomonas phaseoli pv. dieffenbachiae]MBO9776649.1 beta-glucosidase [Xanthomonas phaseoli pv. dieffenbachiae]MBO9778566.1 beta-glucosidase [Xanthomonas phaseoli pv. dieffenbachiae]MBO9794710.1 beta-glucosidase [Xanthomonas phaseoli pv. dieffenbachiae]MBO9800528.1 beta-glucosidase [Xanthomonas phaseoli pv. dieffenbachiae]
MHTPTLFESFFMAGFECSTHRRRDGRRLDLIAATRHDRWAAKDYAALSGHGLRTARDGLRWHLIEQRPRHYDWSSFLPMLHAANSVGTQVIWDLCHYGWPDDVDIWTPQFVDRFARFAAAAAQCVKDASDAAPFYAPLNEISFWAWNGGDHARMHPMARGRGFELKHQLVRATIAAIDAIRQVDPRARFLQVDPAIHVVPSNDRPGPRREAERLRLAQFEAWDMICGRQWPGLGGAPEYLDIIGLNYYSDNQWYLGGVPILRNSPDHRPFSTIMLEFWQRYRRPMIVSETGAEADQRAPWLDHVGNEVALAMRHGVAMEGICLYPVLDYPGWDNDRHCPTGLLGYADEHGERPVHQGLADQLRHEHDRFGLRAPQFALADIAT